MLIINVIKAIIHVENSILNLCSTIIGLIKENGKKEMMIMMMVYGIYI